MNTTFRTLTIGDGTQPPILPNGSYEFSEYKSILKIYGGGEILIKGCDDIFSIRSLNLSAIGVDEGVEIDEEEYQTLTSRLRLDVDDNRQIFTATNPASQNHYLYKRAIEYPDVVI
jgi:phage terminase large subunit